MAPGSGATTVPTRLPYQSVVILTHRPNGQPVTKAVLQLLLVHDYRGDISSSTHYDFLYVRISSRLLLHVARSRETDESKHQGRLAVFQFHVSEFIGQTVQIHFEVTTDSTDKSSFFVDDVSLLPAREAEHTTNRARGER